MVSVRHVGRFVVRSQLGRGEHGPLYVAYDPRLEREVVVRVIADEVAVPASAMAQLSHPNLVQVFEVGSDDAGGAYVVTEYVAGVDLARWLSTELRTPAAIADAFLQAGRGLAAAHAKGIVHGDFKPSNVLVGTQGLVRVTDFGLVRRPATIGGDVRTFWAALQQALGDHITPSLRAAAQRYELDPLLAALEPPKPRRLWLPLAGIVIALAAATAAAMLWLGSDADAASCDPGPAWLTPIERGRVQYAEQTRKDVAGVSAALARVQADLETSFDTVCRAKRDGKLTDAQAKQRTACLHRRVFELDALVDAVLEGETYAGRRITIIDGPAMCLDQEAPPFTDAAKVAAMWNRYARGDKIATAQTTAEHERYLRALDNNAVAANEKELVMRTQLALGKELEFQDRLAEADASYARAHAIALEIKATSHAVFSLLQRSSVARRASDAAAGFTYAQSAESLAKTFTASPLLRTQIYQALGRSAFTKPDYKACSDYMAKAIETLEGTHVDVNDIELDVRIFYVQCLAQQRRNAEAAAEGEKLVARAKQLFGERTQPYAMALNTFAGAKRANGDTAGALALRKQALDKMIESLPAGHPNIVLQYVDYGNELGVAGRVEEAHAQFVKAAESIDSVPSVRAQRTAIRNLLAWSAFETGRYDEALSVARQAVETGLSDHGLDHMRTLQAYGTLMNIALELGHVDEADRAAASLARAYAAKPAQFARQRAMLEGNILADIANRRGNAKQCERLARGSLAAIAESKGPDNDARIVHAMLAECLIAQRRFRDARAEIATAVELGHKVSAREDVIALSEINLARIELAEGKRQAARERAQAARAVLEKYPSQVIAKQRADDILRAKR